MTLLVAAVVGFLSARLLWLVLRPMFASPAFMRDNYAGRAVPTAVGLVLPLGVALVEAGRAVAGAAGIGAQHSLGPGRASVLVAALGLGLVGTLDDLAGTSDVRGFRGHVRALAAGRLSTGGVKLLGGAGVAVVAVAVAEGATAGAPRLLADAALVALGANLANLLDRRPGRAIKSGLVAMAALALLSAAAPELSGAMVVAGGAAALLLDDLRERLMLGDAGANVLGGVIALGVVVACAPGTRNLVLAAVVALNVASEAVSFTRVIEAVPPLRALDRAGRRGLRPPIHGGDSPEG